MNITIGRYPCPTAAERAGLPDVGWPADRWDCYIEPEDRSWIMFLPVEGAPVLFVGRDADGGVLYPPVTSA